MARKLKQMAEKAWATYQKADNLVTQFAGMLKFEGFGWIEPTVTFCPEGIIVVYEGEEMWAEEAIKIMDENGVITVNDFVDTSRFSKRKIAK